MLKSTLLIGLYLILFYVACDAIGLTYTWEFSCTTDTECEYEDEIRAIAEQTPTTHN